MLRINKTSKNFVALQQKTMRESGYWERRDIQEMICRSPQEFCDELGEAVYIVGSEVCPDEFVKDRIDLLGVDETGTAVIIELKRDSHKLQLLQTLAYAGMVSKWHPRQFIEALNKYNRTYFAPARDQTVQQTKEELEETLDDGDTEIVNRAQRILLLAEKFDYEVLITAEWLTERYGLDIRCYRISLAQNGDDEFLSCTRAYPPPELTDVAIRRRRANENVTSGTRTWNEIERVVENPDELKFLKQELEFGRPNNVDRGYFTYRIHTKRRYIIWIKRKFATVLQLGRFAEDEGFWKGRLGEKAEIGQRADGRHLRFRLTTAQDFQAFAEAWNGELQTKAFLAADDDNEPGDQEI